MCRATAASLALVCALSAANGGGTALYPYPIREEVCTGGADEDLDGLADCDDDDCDGQCPEEGAACSNLRDDDGDGFEDSDDPRCWPEAAITLDRCRTIDGSAFDLARNEAFWSADHL